MIGNYMANAKISHIGGPECLPRNPYKFESNVTLTKLYKTYSRIFAGLSLACHRDSPSCTRLNIIREFFDDNNLQKMTYSQIVCKCDKKRLRRVWPTAAPTRIITRISTNTTFGLNSLITRWQKTNTIHEI